MTKIKHRREIDGARRFWETLGITTDFFFFKPDFIVDLSLNPKIAEMFDCNYMWIDLVGTNPPSREKMYWLPRMLSRKWLIVFQRYGDIWEPKRPTSYDGKMSYEETKEAFQKLWRIRYGLKVRKESSFPI